MKVILFLLIIAVGNIYMEIELIRYKTDNLINFLAVRALTYKSGESEEEEESDEFMRNLEFSVCDEKAQFEEFEVGCHVCHCEFDEDYDGGVAIECDDAKCLEND